MFTVDGSVFLHKASVCQRRLAVGAVELLLMPRLPHRYQKRPSDKEETLVTFDFLSVLPEPEQPSFGGSAPPPLTGVPHQKIQPPHESQLSLQLLAGLEPVPRSPTFTEVLC